MNNNIFDNCDSKTNGEDFFFNVISDKINVIFDVGCRNDSIFLNFRGIVHYFDPVNNFMESLKQKSNNNKTSYFNNFGLGNKNGELYYYPRYQSFINRIISCNIDDEQNKILLKIKTAKDYLEENSLTTETIDFLKIDTEGYELNVLQGFEKYVENVKIIQFEYGGTYLDSNIKLIDVIEYLRNNNFDEFYYLTQTHLIPIQDFTDHYKYCNIICVNNNYRNEFLPR